MLLPIVLAILTGCATTGDFCHVVKAPLTFHPDTAAAIVRADRATGERIAVQNEYGSKHCQWKARPGS